MQSDGSPPAQPLPPHSIHPRDHQLGAGPQRDGAEGRGAAPRLTVKLMTRRSPHQHARGRRHIGIRVQSVPHKHHVTPPTPDWSRPCPEIASSTPARLSQVHGTDADTLSPPCTEHSATRTFTHMRGKAGPRSTRGNSEDERCTSCRGGTDST